MGTHTDSRTELPIEIRDLRFGYGSGQFALSVPELRVDSGTTAACIGPSGSGKTTLLHLMAGILLPESGSIALGGEEWARSSEAQRRLRRITNIGLVFQEFELLDHLTVRENILLPYFVQPALTMDSAVETEMEGLARAAGILELSKRKPAALSQGERQRVAICRALVTRPAIVLADEPTGNLDPNTTQVVLDLLMSQVRQRQSTLVMVTHDHGLIEAFDTVVEFDSGPTEATVRMRP